MTDTDQRIYTLEQQLAELRVETAKLDTNVGHLTSVTTELSKNVDELIEAMNKGRGAMVVIGGAGMFIGGVINWAFNHFSPAAPP